MAVEQEKLAALEVGAKIRTLRLELGWSQEQLGVWAGISGGTIRRAEAGAIIPKVEHLMRIAHALSVPVAELLPADIEPNAEGPAPKDRPRLRKKTTGSEDQMSYSSQPSRRRTSKAA